MGDVVAAVDRYADIPAELRSRLKTRMAQRAYDEIVSIRRDSIVGQARYGAEIRDMHFGNGQVCAQVSRAAWAPAAQERGLVYCEAEHCILVPTVCRNVSRISRTSRAPGAVAGAAAASPGAVAGAAAGQAAAGQGAAPGPMADGPAGASDGGAATPGNLGGASMASAVPAPAGALASAQPAAGAVDLSGLPSLVAESAPAAAAATAAASPAGSAGLWANASGMSWLGSTAGGAAILGAAGWASAAGLTTDRQVTALPGNTRGLLTDGGPARAIDLVGVTPSVPEPAGVALWLAGLAGLLAKLRQQRRRPMRAGRVNPG